MQTPTTVLYNSNSNNNNSNNNNKIRDLHENVSKSNPTNCVGCLGQSLKDVTYGSTFLGCSNANDPRTDSHKIQTAQTYNTLNFQPIWSVKSTTDTNKRWEQATMDFRSETVETRTEFL